MSPSSTRASKAAAGLRQAFPARTSSLFEIRRFVRGGVPKSTLSEEAVGDLVLAVSEACANAVVHSGSVEPITVRVRADGEGVEVEVRDGGIFRRRVPMPEFEGTRGHGIPLMMALVDEVSIAEGMDRRPGTVVRLKKLLD
jgi:serine/threonine-protein kinase RsbW